VEGGIKIGEEISNFRQIRAALHCSSKRQVMGKWKSAKFRWTADFSKV